MRRLRSGARPRPPTSGATVHLDTEHDDAKDLGYELLRAHRRRVSRRAAGLRRAGVSARTRSPISRDLVAWSARRAARAAADPAGEGRLLGPRGRSSPGPRAGRCRCSRDKAETDANFERCTRYLVDHAGAVRPAIAQPQPPQPRLRDRVRARRAGLDDDRARAPAALRHGRAGARRARRTWATASGVYAPVGELVPGMAYLVRRLLENTSNESFVRQPFAEGRDLDELVRAARGRRRPRSPTAPPGPPAAADRPRRARPFTNEPHAELRRPGAARGA